MFQYHFIPVSMRKSFCSAYWSSHKRIHNPRYVRDTSSWSFPWSASLFANSSVVREFITLYEFLHHPRIRPLVCPSSASSFAICEFRHHLRVRPCVHLPFQVCSQYASSFIIYKFIHKRAMNPSFIHSLQAHCSRRWGCSSPSPCFVATISFFTYFVPSSWLTQDQWHLLR